MFTCNVGNTCFDAFLVYYNSSAQSIKVFSKAVSAAVHRQEFLTALHAGDDARRSLAETVSMASVCKGLITSMADPAAALDEETTTTMMIVAFSGLAVVREGYQFGQSGQSFLAT
jgi:hypothetical protein